MCFRPPTVMTEDKECPKCGEMVPGEMENCPKCGTNVFGSGMVDASVIPTVGGPSMKFPSAPKFPGVPAAPGASKAPAIPGAPKAPGA